MTSHRSHPTHFIEEIIETNQIFIDEIAFKSYRTWLYCHFVQRVWVNASIPHLHNDISDEVARCEAQSKCDMKVYDIRV